MSTVQRDSASHPFVRTVMINRVARFLLAALRTLLAPSAHDVSVTRAHAVFTCESSSPGILDTSALTVTHSVEP